MRTITPLLKNWTFIKEAADADAAANAAGESVTLPHTWNALDGQDGGNDYHRGTCYYVRALPKPDMAEGAQAYLEFQGAAMTADVYVNGEKLMHHAGGYSAFRVNITGALREENTVVVAVNNEDNDVCYPQKAAVRRASRSRLSWIRTRKQPRSRSRRGQIRIPR